MPIDQTSDATKTLEYGRGDSFATEFTIKNKAGVAIDITGFSFKLTVNSEKNPTDQVSEQFSLVGTITDGLNGLVEFAPSTTDTNISPSKYFYDIEMIDVGSAVRTVIKGTFTITQDVTKV